MLIKEKKKRTLSPSVNAPKSKKHFIGLWYTKRQNQTRGHGDDHGSIKPAVAVLGAPFFRPPPKNEEHSQAKQSAPKRKKEKTRLNIQQP